MRKPYIYLTVVALLGFIAALGLAALLEGTTVPWGATISTQILPRLITFFTALIIAVVLTGLLDQMFLTYVKPALEIKPVLETLFRQDVVPALKNGFSEISKGLEGTLRLSAEARDILDYVRPPYLFLDSVSYVSELVHTLKIVFNEN